jgi:hypothetical protein
MGWGEDGCVWRASLPPPFAETAVKVFDRPNNYQRERDAYLRLRDRGVEHLGDFSVPSLVNHDDELMVVEMTIVQPPFLLDFGKAYVDCRPPYFNDSERISEAEADCRELFETEARWKEIQRALWKLEGMGIWYADPNPRNIQFGEEDHT